MIKVSFIVPVYNLEILLRRCLDSILCQTVSDFEVIMVDDKFMTSIENVCMEYVNKDKRFAYYYQADACLSIKRNVGMEYAKGDYIAFIDSDDYIEPNFIKDLYDNAKETNADILCFGHKRNLENDVLINSFESKVINITGDILLKYFCQDWLLQQRKNYAWSKIYKNQFIKNTGVKFNPKARYTEDRNFMYKILFQAKKIAYSNVSPYFYYQHEKSITHSSAMQNNLFEAYYTSHQDILVYWQSKKMDLFNCIEPIILIRALQSAMFNTQQTVNDLKKTADAALSAFKSLPILDTLELNNLKKAINVFAENCELSWVEQSKIWLFSLSLMGDADAIIAWQKLYPIYTESVKKIT